MSSGVQLPTTDVIMQLSSDGVLALNYPQAASDGAQVPIGAVGTWQLLSYTGNHTQDLVGYPDAAALQIDSSVMTYLDADQQPQVAPITPRTVVRPRSLGAPIAPTTYADKRGHTWTSYQPFSAAITSCHVTVRHHGHVVRHLTCSKSDRALGDVLVHWKGTNSAHHRVAAGRYTWKTVVANSAGSELGPGGTHKTLTGTIKISR